MVICNCLQYTGTSPWRESNVQELAFRQPGLLVISQRRRGATLNTPLPEGRETQVSTQEKRCLGAGNLNWMPSKDHGGEIWVHLP